MENEYPVGLGEARAWIAYTLHRDQAFKHYRSLTGVDIRLLREHWIERSTQMQEAVKSQEEAL